MKKQGHNKIKLGIFVSLGIFFLIIGIYFIGKKQQLFNKTINISCVFKDISGLQIGDNVRLSGINIGVISAIEIVTDTSVKVDLVIDKKTKKFIKKDAKATIGSDGLMGNKIVIITAGTSGKKEIEDDDVITTFAPVTMDDILAKLKTTTTNAASITDDLSVIMGNIRSGKGTIGKLFMDTVFAKNIDQSVINIKQGTNGFKQDMDAAGHNFLLRGYLKKKEKEKEEKKDDKK
ncbi:MAG: MlaD family protein [Bacteroidia bacterium]